MNTKTRKQHRRMLEELEKLADKASPSDRPLLRVQARLEVQHRAQC